MLSFENMVPASTDFARLYTVSDYETLADYICVKYQQGTSISNIVEDISHKKYNVDTRWIDWNALVKAVISHASNNLTGVFEQVYLYQEELDKLKQIKSEAVRKFLYLALIVHKWNNHPSGWVRYEREDFFKFWGMQKLKNKEKEAIAHEAVEHGLELRVVGSKKPVICYHIAFLQLYGEVVAMFDNEVQIKQWWEWLAL